MTTTTSPTIEAVKSLRDLRKRADKSTAEIRTELVIWQKKLPRGKFKQAYLKAGWTESRIAHYLYGDRHKKKSAARSRNVQTHLEVAENNGTQYADVPDYLASDVSDVQTPEVSDAQPEGRANDTNPYTDMLTSINNCSRWAEDGFPGATAEILQGVVADQST